MKTKLIIAALSLPILCFAITDEEYVARNGGYVQIKGKGYVAAIDCRQPPNFSEYREAIAKVKDLFNISVNEVRGEPFSFATAKEQILKSKGNLAVFIVDDPSLPFALAAQEEKWTLVNAAKLKTDNPDVALFAKRMSKMFARQCFRVLGSDEHKSPSCCFYPVFSVADLDQIKSLDLTMGPYMAIGEVMERFGIEPIEFGTYTDACELGVAPPPTNDVQKAIWEKVKNKKIDAKDPTARWKRDFEKK